MSATTATTENPTRILFADDAGRMPWGSYLTLHGDEPDVAVSWYDGNQTWTQTSRRFITREPNVGEVIVLAWEDGLGLALVTAVSPDRVEWKMLCLAYRADSSDEFAAPALWIDDPTVRFIGPHAPRVGEQPNR